MHSSIFPPVLGPQARVTEFLTRWERLSLMAPNMCKYTAWFTGESRYPPQSCCLAMVYSLLISVRVTQLGFHKGCCLCQRLCSPGTCSIQVPHGPLSSELWKEEQHYHHFIGREWRNKEIAGFISRPLRRLQSTKLGTSQITDHCLPLQDQVSFSAVAFPRMLPEHEWRRVKTLLVVLDWGRKMCRALFEWIQYWSEF